jgi:hypothetical protein
MHLHHPDTAAALVGPLPQFVWEACEGAISYVIILKKVAGVSGDSWIYRLNDTACCYRDDSNVTYSDRLGDSLDYDTDYYFELWGLDTGNYGRAGIRITISTPSISGLRGFYNGTYMVIEDFGGSHPVVLEQFIDWVFTDYRFFCQADTTLGEKIFCDFSGYYSLTNKVTFSNVLIGPGICNPDHIPEGDFSFIRIIGDGAPDTLLLEQLTTVPETVLKQIILIPDSI